MIQSALAMLAGSSLAFAATPSAAAVTVVNYTVTGTATGSFALNFDTVTTAYTYNSSNLTVAGVSYLTTAVAAFGLLSPPYSIFATVNGDAMHAGVDDFIFQFDPALTTQSTTYLSYATIQNTTGFFYGQSTITRPAAAVPEPATWALMLLGFGGIGMVMRRAREATGSLRHVV